MLGYFENVIWLTIFSGISSEKVVYEFQNQFFHFHHQNKFILFSTQHGNISWIFSSKSWDLDSKLRECGTRVILGLFFLNFWTIKTKLKTNLTLNLILGCNLRLEGYSIRSATVRARLRRAQGFFRSGTTTLRKWYRYSRLRNGAWAIPYTCCNYSDMSRTSQNRRKLPE